MSIRSFLRMILGRPFVEPRVPVKQIVRLHPDAFVEKWKACGMPQLRFRSSLGWLDSVNYIAEFEIGGQTHIANFQGSSGVGILYVHDEEFMEDFHAWAKTT
ncbi:MAG: hypothetical protein NUV56_04490 [Candidatus Uhrbacteria bacterium]|nr:hypothetical protein [Candidatus Uhrbacteria bacterium]